VFERFTDRARQVVVLSQEEARLLRHNHIGTEHLLLGLLREGEGVAAQVLESQGVSLETVRGQIERLVGPDEAGPSGHIPFTPRAKKVLELALREAMQLGCDYIGTEHLLLGLIREGEGVAAQALVGLGLVLDQVRQQVIETAGDEPDAARDEPDAAHDHPGEPPTALGRLRGLLTGRGDEPRARAMAVASRTGTEPRPSAATRTTWNLTVAARRGALEPVAGRDAEIARILELLCRRRRNNVLIVGESGAGKTALVHGVAQALVEDDAPPPLRGTHIYELDHVLLWTADLRRLRNLDLVHPRPREAEAAGRRVETVRFVDDLDSLLSAEPDTGFAASTLRILCESPTPLIATMTPATFEALRTSRAALAERFEHLPIRPQNAEEAVATVTALRERLEAYYGVTFGEQSLNLAVTLAAQHRRGDPPLVAALDLIDAAAARLHATGDRDRGRSPEGSGSEQSRPPLLEEDLLTAIAAEQDHRAA